jgi:crotonobetainyl-CoA:carnitine CoA-transferase CaiB-like acyl-CoA transferase
MAKARADVIKIEPPQGEPLHRRAPPGKSTTFRIAMLNSNKRAITLNLKRELGRALLFRMVERADVLLENFAPGVMDRLGVGWEVLHRVNPRLVSASGSGYGLTGRDRDNLAMDLTIQAVSGMIAATGFSEGPPVKAGPAVVDFISGIHLYAATLTALFGARAQRPGPPCRGGDAGGRVCDPDITTARLFRDQPDAAAHRQRQPWPRAIERLPDQ